MADVAKREIWLDIVRGVAIILVIIGHALRDEMQEDYYFFHLMYRLLYSFHMNLFFFLSGVSYALFSRESDVLEFCGRKFGKLLIPWMSYSLLIYAIYLIVVKILLEGGNSFPGIGGIVPFWEYIKETIHCNNPYAFHVWYIYALFFIQILTLLLDLVMKKIRVRYNIILLFVISGCLIFAVFKKSGGG